MPNVEKNPEIEDKLKDNPTYNDKVDTDIRCINSVAWSVQSRMLFLGPSSSEDGGIMTIL